MAVTFTVTPRAVVSEGGLMVVFSDVSCTGTPTVGGDALTAVALGLKQMIAVEPLGNAGVVGATSAAAIQVIHPTTQVVSQVLVAFMVQGTAGAANSMVAYSGATAGFIFRVKAYGKTATAAAASIT